MIMSVDHRVTRIGEDGNDWRSAVGTRWHSEIRTLVGVDGMDRVKRQDKTTGGTEINALGHLVNEEKQTH